MPSGSDSSLEVKAHDSNAQDDDKRHSGVTDNDEDLSSEVEKSGSAQHDVEKQAETNAPAAATATAKDPNLVEFDGPDDPGNPKNWSARRRTFITIAMGLMTFVVTFSSSIFAVAIEPVSIEYGVEKVIATLGVAFFLFGFVLGPIAFGPASEVYGRWIPLFSGYVVFAIFQIPVAVARNIETILPGRFFSGFAASAPLAIIGGALADMWDPVERAYAVCAFAAGAFSGPVAGPISMPTRLGSSLRASANP